MLGCKENDVVIMSKLVKDKPEDEFVIGKGIMLIDSVTMGDSMKSEVSEFED